MSDEETGRTVLERMAAAGIGEDRARTWIETGWVRTGERVITDPSEVVDKFVIAPGITSHI